MTLNHTNKHAFTLTELLAVIAIMAALTLVAVPTLRSIQSTALQSAARQVSNSLQLARQYAITHRTLTRFVIAVDQSSGNVSDHLICRAYTVCAETNNVEGAHVGWIPIEDWKVLPEGVVFSDLNSTSYNLLTLDSVPTLGNSGTRLISGSDTNQAWKYFNNSGSITVYLGGASKSWQISSVEFKPTGIPNNITSPSAAGIRLVQGSVLIPSSRSILVTDTNNWIYIEYDKFGGRVRTRYRETYQ